MPELMSSTCADFHARASQPGTYQQLPSHVHGWEDVGRRRFDLTAKASRGWYDSEDYARQVRRRELPDRRLDVESRLMAAMKENGRPVAAVFIPTNPYPPTPDPLSARDGGGRLLSTGSDPS